MGRGDCCRSRVYERGATCARGAKGGKGYHSGGGTCFPVFDRFLC